MEEITLQMNLFSLETGATVQSQPIAILEKNLNYLIKQNHLKMKTQRNSVRYWPDLFIGVRGFYSRFHVDKYP